MKTCNKCDVMKDITEYHKHKRNKDGLQSTCKPCRHIQRAEHYANNKERKDELQRLWRSDPDNRQTKKLWDKAYKNKHKAYYLHLSNQRRARKIERTVSWANIDKIKDIYKEATLLRQQGHDVHVDHIIPLQGTNVSGLHVENNLQIITAEENLKKRNNFVDRYPYQWYNNSIDSKKVTNP